MVSQSKIPSLNTLLFPLKTENSNSNVYCFRSISKIQINFFFELKILKYVFYKRIFYDFKYFPRSLTSNKMGLIFVLIVFFVSIFLLF